MSKQSTERWSRKAAMRLRGFRERASRWRTRIRRAATLALVSAGIAAMPSLSHAQFGQTAMAPAGGIVNRAVAGFQGLNDNGPGVLYYGINAADRGLGYLGSYMTLGGFVPMAEDDLGGFWSADLRGHLSAYGGFFSNVGAVRKQFIGGTLLGVGIYWDYDGDQNQYSDTVLPVGAGNTYTFAGGYSYNQVGISGEWLTDWGNLRSNGYIPVGETGQLVGPFLGNSLLCVNGVNAALGGADLEVGAYIPSLADWAGMISVGGYAYGNTRYEFPGGRAAVPWFGGVYTRLDVTLIQNWDFSLQYNNDSYFDSTGFARLTYRMGGSRRRNVPDQVEQPMMRNEHVVRAHQVPEVAINPNNLDPATGQPLAWQVYHVDNTAAPGGNGTAENPFASLPEASAAATAAYDVVYVRQGTSSVTSPYITQPDGFTFNASNQYLIGEGSSFMLPTTLCGDRAFFGGNVDRYPVISNPLGPTIVLDQPSATVNHVQIVGSPLGISDGTGISAPDIATVNDVIIQGSGGAAQRGILIANSTGTFNFDGVRLRDLGNDGLVVTAANGRVEMDNSSFERIARDAVRALGPDSVVNLRTTTMTSTDDRALVAEGVNSRITLARGTIQTTGGDAVVASGAGSRADIASSSILDTRGAALLTSGTGARITTADTRVRNAGSTGAAVRLSGDDSNITIASTFIDDVTGIGARLNAAGSVFNMTSSSRIQNTGADGILVDNADAFAIVSGKSKISQAGGNGITSTGGRVQVVDSTIERVTDAGILATNVSGLTAAGAEKAIWVQGATIQNAGVGGIVVTDSDLRVEQVDPTRLSSTQTRILNTGVYGVRAVATPAAAVPSNVLVDQTTISGANIGISIAANPGTGVAPIPEINFTGTDNSITTIAEGTGINLSAAWDADPAALGGTTLSRVNAIMTGNEITTRGGDGILLTSVGGPLQYPAPGGGVFLTPAAVRPISIQAGSSGNLSSLNNGTNVVSEPAAVTPEVNINYNPALILTPPAPPPAPPLPAT